MSRSLLALLLVVAACPSRPTPSAHTVAPVEPGRSAATAAPPVAPGRRAAGKTTVFHLHKFLLRVGVEVDTFVPDGAGGVEAQASFGFQDRGTQVTLAGRYRLAADGTPQDGLAWGKTSRMSSIDEGIARAADGMYSVLRLGEDAAQVCPAGPVAVASGYAPLLATDLMLRAWTVSAEFTP